MKKANMKKLLSGLLVAAVGLMYVSGASAQDIGNGSANQGTTIDIPSIKIVRTTGDVTFNSDDITAGDFATDGTNTITKQDATDLTAIHNYGSTSQKITVEWADGAPSGFGTGSSDHQLALQPGNTGFTTVANESASDLVTGLSAGAVTYNVDYRLTINAAAGQVNESKDLTFTLTAVN